MEDSQSNLKALLAKSQMKCNSLLEIVENYQAKLEYATEMLDKFTNSYVKSSNKIEHLQLKLDEYEHINSSSKKEYDDVSNKLANLDSLYLRQRKENEIYEQNIIDLRLENKRLKYHFKGNEIRPNVGKVLEKILETTNESFVSLLPDIEVQPVDPYEYNLPGLEQLTFLEREKLESENIYGSLNNHIDDLEGVFRSKNVA
jgi:chromosome segregation ATPase